MEYENADFRKLFTLSNNEPDQLLGIMKTAKFSPFRASYWACTKELLESEIYSKIEKAVELILGRQVYFIVDEIVTPFGVTKSKDNF